jgi:hypothetical protein
MISRRSVFDFALTFYPMILSSVAVPLAIAAGMPWIGVVVCLVLLLLMRTWWTCIFGLMNWMCLIVGIVWSLLPYLKWLLNWVRQV